MDLLPEEPALWARMSPDGKLIATSSKDGTARLSDAQTGRGLRVLPSQGGEVTSAAFSPDGQYLVATSLDNRDSQGTSRPGTARVWRVATGEQVAELGETAYGGVWGADFSRDGKRLVTASEDNTARVWEVGSWRKLHDLIGHSGRVSRAVFSPDGKTILTT
ncbi:MAG: PD40 domain-containing protein, partial [Saprospiraceae bacterium]|nr:PD40 domain-containing protein [Saprospiraceae bacterium]